MSLQINKDTKIYGSFSSNPGNNGTFFFNHAFQKHNINAIYKSFYSDNLKNTITSVKSLGFCGFAISMPFKIEILEYLDDIEETALEIGSVNTVIISNKKLKGYNTDYYGVKEYFKQYDFNKINILGNGGLSKSIQKVCFDNNISYIIHDRNDIEKIDDVYNEIFINATPSDIFSKNNKIIDFRPFTQDGSELFRYQAIKQFKLYTGIEYEYS